MTTGMRWCIVGTLCFCLVLLTIAGVSAYSNAHPGKPEPSCARHGGVVSTREDSGTNTTFFICRDGEVVERP